MEKSIKKASPIAQTSSKLRPTGIFKYEKLTGMIFTPEENLPDKFRNLKKTCKKAC
jgi:hypothetical protein